MLSLMVQLLDYGSINTLFSRKNSIQDYLKKISNLHILLFYKYYKNYLPLGNIIFRKNYYILICESRLNI